MQTASSATPGPLADRLSIAEPYARDDRAEGRGPLVALAAIVVLAAGGYGAAAQLVPLPLLNPDELRYTLATRALADGEWPNLRGEDYGLGPLYPLVLAPILALSDGVESAYPFFKVANAVLFALAAVPLYFIARRLLPPWWSVAVAATSVAIPSSIYTSLVLTESAAYLTSAVALLTLVLALERPSVGRQLAMLGAVGLAYATRPQFAVLVPAFLAGYLLLWALHAGRPRLRDAAARLWPTLGAAALVVAILAARPLLTSSAPKDALGGYEDLWRGYDLALAARLAVYHLAGLELYLFVVPFVVAPVVVAGLLRAARRGATREGAFVATFLAVNAVLVAIAAAFASTPYGYSELHDRYLFYVAPLWLVMLGLWLSSGLPRPLVWLAVGVALSLVLAVSLPFGLIGGNLVLEAVPTALWSWVWTTVEGTPFLDGSRVLGVCVVVLTVAAAALPRRLWPVLPAVVCAGLLLTAALAWERVVDAPQAFVQADETNRTWVDDAVADGSTATKLYRSPPECPYSELIRHAFFLTELFNASIDRTAAIGGSIPDGLPVERVDVGPGGRLLLGDGKPLVASYVVTQSGIELVGRRIGAGTGARLVLWETRGAVRMADARPGTGELLNADCE